MYACPRCYSFNESLTMSCWERAVSKICYIAGLCSDCRCTARHNQILNLEMPRVHPVVIVAPISWWRRSTSKWNCSPASIPYSVARKAQQYTRHSHGNNTCCHIRCTLLHWRKLDLENLETTSVGKVSCRSLRDRFLQIAITWIATFHYVQQGIWRRPPFNGIRRCVTIFCNLFFPTKIYNSLN